LITCFELLGIGKYTACILFFKNRKNQIAKPMSKQDLWIMMSRNVFKAQQAVLFFFGFTGILHGQPIFQPSSLSNKRVVEAQLTNERIFVDGKLSEKIWEMSVQAKSFVQSTPNQGQNATYDTHVSVLYDDKNLYIGAYCFTNGEKLLVQDLRRDFLYSNNELFGVFIDPFQNVQSPVLSFLVTPYGSQRDLLIYDDRIYDLNWDAVWKAASHISDSSWSTEIAIPWSTMRYPSDSTTWSINFNRNIRNLNEVTGWSPWPRAYTVGRMSYAGLLTNIHPPENKMNVRVQPYIVGNVSKNAEQSKTTGYLATGGEIKWLISPNASLEGTFNTDFAQSEVDRQVINLKRSFVFFPERRQFFLENANLFSVGHDEILQPFFSRRIGLDSLGLPLRIRAGGRFIHQNSKRALGLMAVTQAEGKAEKADFFIARFQENFGKSRIGALVTYRNDRGLDNTIASVDGLLRISEPLY
jgi:hypothetical protein